jgi:hypothetical protein
VIDIVLTGCLYVLCLQLVFLNAYRNNSQVHGSSVIALHTEVFRVLYFPTSNGGILLANSSKDNTRVELEWVEKDSYGITI